MGESSPAGPKALLDRLEQDQREGATALRNLLEGVSDHLDAEDAKFLFGQDEALLAKVIAAVLQVQSATLATAIKTLRLDRQTAELEVGRADASAWARGLTQEGLDVAGLRESVQRMREGIFAMAGVTSEVVARMQRNLEAQRAASGPAAPNPRPPGPRGARP